MYQLITSATEETSFVKEVFDGARNKISLPFLVVERFFLLGKSHTLDGKEIIHHHLVQYVNS
jgi:hypothetical protein